MKLAYSIARYVPSLVRGEAINIGVALQVPETQRLLLKFSGSLSRTRLIFPDADAATIGLLKRHFKQAEETDITSEPFFAYTRLDHLTLGGLVNETRNTVLQFSEPAVTIADNPQSELEDLYETFVTPRPAGAARVFASVQIAPAQLRARLYRRFDKAGLIGPRRMLQQVRLPGTVFPWEFDLGHANGKVDIVQSIALKAPDDIAVNRALLLAARVEDVRDAGRTSVGRVIAAADQASASASVRLLERHAIEVRDIASPQLVEAVEDLLTPPARRR
jgi:hypothetical protein